MKNFQFTGLPVPVSQMIYGTAIRPLMEGRDADDILDLVLKNGITTFDTARSYGCSEEGLGKWVEKRGIRDKINILTKGCNPDQTGIKFSKESLTEELEQSLHFLRTDYVDMYCLHRDDPTVDVQVFIEVLNEFQAAGKIRIFGASNWNYKRMDAANEFAYAHNLNGFSFGSPAFSLAEVIRDPWGGSVHLSGKDNADARKWFEENRIPVFAYSSFARGFFSGKYRTDMREKITEVLPPWTCEEYLCEENIERLHRTEILAKEKHASVGQINLAWILAQPFLCFPIFSPSSPTHLLENLEGLKLKLSEKEMRWLNLEE